MPDDPPRRIQRKRTKGWRMPEGAVYVGRPTRWANPYRAGLQWTPSGERNATPEEAVRCYVTWLRHEMYMDCTVLPSLVAELRGHDLACWCPLGAPCHADVLLELANREDNDDGR